MPDPCPGKFHMLTVPREGRSPAPIRCRCGALFHLPDAPPERALQVNRDPVEEPDPGALAPARAREIQSELSGIIWR